MITQKQKNVLDFIKTYSKKRGYSPSIPELARHFKRAVGTIHEHIQKLQEGGYLRKEENKRRGIEISETEKLVQIPLLGTIAAGQPIDAMQEREMIAIPKTKIQSGQEYFALKVLGQSMVDENINDGDVVLVRQQNVAENGEKVVALIDNYEATLKTFFKERGQIRLQPANKNYEPIIIKNGKQEFSVQGIVIDVIRNEITSPQILERYEVKKPVSKYHELPLNKFICGDAAKELKKIPDNSIDLIVMSPPYDEIRKYNGFSFDLHATGKEIYRVLKEGGIAVMVIQDQTKNFGKSLTSFRTIVDWVDNIGFKLFETVIYRKYGAEGAWWNKRFRVDHEYMPIFLKGERPRYFNKEPLKIPSKHGGKTMTGGGTRLTNGVRIATRPITINPMKCRGTIWEYMTAGDGTRLKHQHPATFPDNLPYDFIQCFCPPNGIVLDPFMGSGTTALAAIKLERNYIGIDISKEYCELAKKRIKEEGAVNRKLF